VSVVRDLCCGGVLLALSGLSASADQWTWKGSLDQLDEFTEVINLSDERTARQVLIGALSDPGIQLESVAIHAYTRWDACQDAFIGRRLANHYGALSLSLDSEGNIEKAWFDELNDACNPNGRTWTTLCAADGGPDEECEIANVLAEFARNARDGDQFIYTTAPLPYTASLADLRGLCGDPSDRGPSDGGGGDSVCDRKLSLR